MLLEVLCRPPPPNFQNILSPLSSGSSSDCYTLRWLHQLFIFFCFILGSKIFRSPPLTHLFMGCLSPQIQGSKGIQELSTPSWAKSTCSYDVYFSLQLFCNRRRTSGSNGYIQFRLQLSYHRMWVSLYTVSVCSRRNRGQNDSFFISFRFILFH